MTDEVDPATSKSEGHAAAALDDTDRSRMPAWIPRVILMVILSVAAALATFAVFQRVRSLIVWLVISLFLSFALEPGVNWLSERGWRRGAATGFLLFGLFVLGTVLVASMIPLVIAQVQDLIQSVPGWLDQVSVYTERWFDYELSTDKLVSQLRDVDDSLGNYAGNLAGNLLGFGAAVLGAVLQFFTIALFTFYLVADGPKLRRTVCSLLPPQRQREVLWAWNVAIDKTGGYLYSRLLLATISGIATFVVLTVVGVPFALPLALWTGLLSQFIPVVGTYIAMLVPLLVAVLDSPPSALVLVIYFTVYQQIENYLLSPRITARTMQLHPAVAFGAAIVGGSLMGAIGAFLALPAAAILQASLSTYLKRHEVMESDLTGFQEPQEPAPSEKRTGLFARGKADQPST